LVPGFCHLEPGSILVIPNLIRDLGLGFKAPPLVGTDYNLSLQIYLGLVLISGFKGGCPKGSESRILSYCKIEILPHMGQPARFSSV
jgi:hypothetical protein